MTDSKRLVVIPYEADLSPPNGSAYEHGGSTYIIGDTLVISTEDGVVVTRVEAREGEMFCRLEFRHTVLTSVQAGDNVLRMPQLLKARA